MKAIVNLGPVSRAELARQTGMSKQTASEVVRMLEEEGWIEEQGFSQGNIGRAAVLYQVVPQAAYILGVDLGGTKITLAIADLSGRLVGEVTQPTHPDGGQHIVAQITRMGKNLAETSRIPWKKLKLGVVGTPGVVNFVSGFIDSAPNISDFDRTPLQKSLSLSLGFDVIIENDVNLAVIGESWQGAGQGISNLAFIAIGTGVGQGLIVHGKLVRGSRGAAGEIGDIPIGDDPFNEETRKLGAFESVIGGRNLLRRYQAAGGDLPSVQAMFDAANAGDAVAIRIIDETARLIALGVATTAAICDPERVIFGGSIGQRDDLVDRIRGYLPLCMRHPVPIESSALGGRAPVVGALAVGLSRLHSIMYGTDLAGAEVGLPPAPEPHGDEVAR